MILFYEVISFFILQKKETLFQGFNQTLDEEVCSKASLGHRGLNKGIVKPATIVKGHKHGDSK